ncbi:MAG: hydrogenase formation protein HypD [Candidatus Syntrophoarchaeum caldarius]|uniref:Hydrogenase formation protein HypD n=1 Tax=Candidatus Syntropharchaeum caldarium TaxID=1838285 RepID=A0A1F2P942_9EURY|nr:MAG: hydrogenase formation protein HypD [Candidatus Syntrophoarchaeum caldarius]
MFRYREKDIAKRILERLKELNLEIRIMHVCGTHQDTLVRFGLSDLLCDAGVEIRQGPGCPVCVTTPMEIDEAITLAMKGKTIATFGDMLRVPGENGSLFDAKAEGCDIRTVYSINESIEIAKKIEKDLVFMAIGFETTAPSTASTILNNPPENFSVLTCHRAIPPAMEVLLKMGELKIDGFIDPGHVSTIIGTKPYELISQKFNVPQVIAGFEPLDLLMGVYMIARQIKNGEARVENEYTRVVKEEGNKKALKVMDEVFRQSDLGWRGFSVIPESGFSLKEEFERYDSRKRFEDELKELQQREFKEPEGCKCGEVLRGIIYSDECPLFGGACTPQHPVGPCMVSREGSCNILLRHGR